MKSLSRIPFWLWLIILTIFCYAVWNPSDTSVVALMKSEAAMSTKILIGLVFAIIFALFTTASYRSLGQKGLIAYLLLIGAIFYFLFDHDVLNKDISAGFFKYTAPFFVALLLAIGSQGSKIYRAITGRVSVEDKDTIHPDDQNDLDH